MVGVGLGKSGGWCGLSYSAVMGVQGWGVQGWESRVGVSRVRAPRVRVWRVMAFRVRDVYVAPVSRISHCLSLQTVIFLITISLTKPKLIPKWTY